MADTIADEEKRSMEAIAAVAEGIGKLRSAGLGNSEASHRLKADSETLEDLIEAFREGKISAAKIETVREAEEKAEKDVKRADVELKKHAPVAGAKPIELKEHIARLKKINDKNIKDILKQLSEKAKSELEKHGREAKELKISTILRRLNIIIGAYKNLDDYMNQRLKEHSTISQKIADLERLEQEYNKATGAARREQISNEIKRIAREIKKRFESYIPKDSAIERQERAIRDSVRQVEAEIKAKKRLLSKSKLTLPELMSLNIDVGNHEWWSQQLVDKTLFYGVGKYRITGFDKDGIHLVNRATNQEVENMFVTGLVMSERYAIPIKELHHVLNEYNKRHMMEKQQEVYAKLEAHLKKEKTISRIKPDLLLELHQYLIMQKRGETEIKNLFENKIIIVHDWHNFRFKFLVLRYHENNVYVRELESKTDIPQGIPMTAHILTALDWIVQHVVMQRARVRLEKKIRSAKDTPEGVKNLGNALKLSEQEIKNFPEFNNIFTKDDVAMMLRLKELKDKKQEERHKGAIAA